MKNIHKTRLIIPIIVIFTFTIPLYTSYAQEKLSAHPQDWMSKIDSSRPISKINIPGTHDSGSFTLEDPVKSIWGKTQHLNYTDQMNQGVRFFDIRGRATSNKSIGIHHDLIYLHHQLGKFLDDAHQFLQKHPSETIIMSIKKDYGPAPDTTNSFEQIFRENYFESARFKDYFYKENKVNPTLADTKGKIIIFNRMGNTYTSSGYATQAGGIRWLDNKTFNTIIQPGSLNLYVQDEYKDYYNPKKSAVINLINKAKSDASEKSIYVNFLSVSSGGTAFNSPYAYASYMNPDIAKYIKEHQPSRVGWIITDYSGYKWNGYDDINEQVIDSNK
ncbi:phosphatidylinositol-specific phospholipase C [Staphylococcus agnetis]|uniref:phosphatidylinositol-specific phospholipase C n=1 Tax=Staphylococcus agnetis TaxID=985762 RepID=UPI00208DF8E5|nr:phosphatidylinositol-specific phospholipase C [Staphylococcus agnetis]MCO4339686.1 phosphatidylinositol-specific phospholipase C [Staphylococcus agnetis]MCO4349227.1 phosphatidylinositol-specific phospholipase C [Staphylococcus agnetis]MCO4361015.1 phosphatidylinositol-specific phospholipase C [Staphylococcus agnetis]MCO4372641.1 phosphatidylinositol-specific phospholipase C [Staphylococcus agnetis]